MAVNTKYTGFYNIPYNQWGYILSDAEWKDGMIFYLENEINVPENSTLGKDRVWYCTRSSDILVGDILFYNPDYQTNNIPKFVVVRPHISDSGVARIELMTIDRINISQIDTIPVGVCVMPSHFDPDGMTHFMYVKDLIPNNADRIYIPLFLISLQEEIILLNLNILTKAEIQNPKITERNIYIPSITTNINDANLHWRFIYEKLPKYDNNLLNIYTLDCNKAYDRYTANNTILTSPLSFTHYKDGISAIYSYLDNSTTTLAWPYDEMLEGKATNFAYKSTVKSNFDDKSQYLNYDINGYKNTNDILNLGYLLSAKKNLLEDEDLYKVLNDYDPMYIAANFKIPAINDDLKWYLPSIGELLHVACRCMTIQLSLQALLGQSIGAMLSKGVFYYSSSICKTSDDAISIFMLDTDAGVITLFNDKAFQTDKSKIRPFIKLRF